MTDDNGQFAFELPNNDGRTRQLKLEGASIVERVVYLGSPTARSIDVDAIALGAGFDPDSDPESSVNVLQTNGKAIVIVD